MPELAVRALGLGASAAVLAFFAWLIVAQPATVSEVAGGLAATVGAYRIDEQAFADGLEFFRRDRFPESRAAFSRADPASRDPQTQFYVAYSFYRQGWGRLYRDDALFAEGLRSVEAALALAPGGRIVVADPNLQMQSGDELKAELEAGLIREAADFNPLRVFEARK